MNTTCSNCSQEIEIDGPTLASLQGTAHFECPTCQAAVPVPPVPGRTPTPPRPNPERAHSSAMVQTHKGMNRNLLVLGVMTLLVLGGIAAFIAMRGGGNILNRFNNITNQIIHNSYFQNLIASGHAKMSDLETITTIRPFREGFIGISEEALTWSQAGELAKRTASSILVLEQEGSIQLPEITKWLDENIKSSNLPTLWVTSRNEAKVLDGSELLSPPSLQRKRKVVLQWNLPTGKIGETTEVVKRLQAMPPRPDRTGDIAKIRAAIDELERKLASLNGKFDWGLHNELRHNYGGLKLTYKQISADNERIEMWHCNEIFMRNVCDGYILECISDWRAKTDPQGAAEMFMSWTEKYPEFPYLTASCLLRSAELLGPETDRGKEILLKFSKMQQPGLDKYRAKAKNISKPSQLPPGQ